jgi:hypothetical protein
MSEPQKVARLDLSTTSPSPDAVPTSFSEAPSKQTKRLHQLKPSAKIDLTTHGPVRPEPEPEAAPKPKAQSKGSGKPGRHKQKSGGQKSGGSRQQGRGRSAAPSGSTLADLLDPDVLAKLRGE